jgi:hypothetical protein
MFNHKIILLQCLCQRDVSIRKELCCCELRIITRWRNWLRYCAINQKVAGSIQDVKLEFFTDIILPSAVWPWVDSISNRIWGKGDRYVGLTTLPLSSADCLEIWDPETLKPIGPVQACTWLLYFYIRVFYSIKRGPGSSDGIATGYGLDGPGM